MAFHSLAEEELVKLATRLIVEEALEGEAADAIGRDCYEIQAAGANSKGLGQATQARRKPLKKSVATEIASPRTKYSGSNAVKSTRKTNGSACKASSITTASAIADGSTKRNTDNRAVMRSPVRIAELSSKFATYALC